MSEHWIQHTGERSAFATLPAAIRTWLQQPDCPIQDAEVNPWYREVIPRVEAALLRHRQSYMATYREVKDAPFPDVSHSPGERHNNSGESGESKESSAKSWPVHLHRLPLADDAMIYFVGQDERTKVIYWAEVSA